MRRNLFVALLLLSAAGAGAGWSGSADPVRFRVRIENVSASRASSAMDGIADSARLSPGVWVVHNEMDPLFTPGRREPGRGLEALAEDGEPARLDRALRTQDGALSAGVFEVAEGGSKPGPIGPGSAYEFTITAKPGTRLTFATALLQANDLFLAPDETGIPLFDASGRPVQGDVTDRILLWDAGTEAHEALGHGVHQASSQPRRNTGPDENGTVRAVGDGFAYPKAADLVRVTLSPRR